MISNTIVASPPSYGQTVYCTEEKIEEVEHTLDDVWELKDSGEKHTEWTENWTEWTQIEGNLFTDSVNYARFNEEDNTQYYERVSKFTQHDPR